MVHNQEVVGSNPSTICWIDVSDASYYIKDQFKIKVAKWGTPKKIFKECYQFRLRVVLLLIIFNL
jgi:hypothetical protein